MIAELDSLVERAVKSNLDMEMALDRLQQARAYEAVIMGYALPEVDASGGGGSRHRQRSDQGPRRASLALRR